MLEKAIVLTLSVILSLGVSIQPLAAENKKNNVIYKENYMQIITKKIIKNTNTLSINLQYPVIEGLDNINIQNQINLTFKKLATDILKEAKENEKILPQNTQGIKSSAELNYKIEYNKNNIFSIVFKGYLYAGGAHGNYIQSSYTYNLKTGKEYKLKDLFNGKFNYVALINNEIKRQAKEKGIILELLPKSISQDQKFYLTKDSLVVYYDNLPYAVGIPEFTIKYSIKNNIKMSSHTLK